MQEFRVVEGLQAALKEVSVLGGTNHSLCIWGGIIVPILDKARASLARAWCPPSPCAVCSQHYGGSQLGRPCCFYQRDLVWESGFPTCSHIHIRVLICSKPPLLLAFVRISKQPSQKQSPVAFLFFLAPITHPTCSGGHRTRRHAEAGRRGQREGADGLLQSCFGRSGMNIIMKCSTLLLAIFNICHSCSSFPDFSFPLPTLYLTKSKQLCLHHTLQSQLYHFHAEALENEPQHYLSPNQTHVSLCMLLNLALSVPLYCL